MFRILNDTGISVFLHDDYRLCSWWLAVSDPADKSRTRPEDHSCRGHPFSGHLTTLTYSWRHDVQLILNQAAQRRIFLVKERWEDECGTWRSPNTARTPWLTAIVPYDPSGIVGDDWREITKSSEETTVIRNNNKPQCNFKGFKYVYGMPSTQTVLFICI
jgi:hypothetical protein